MGTPSRAFASRRTQIFVSIWPKTTTGWLSEENVHVCSYCDRSSWFDVLSPNLLFHFHFCLAIVQRSSSTKSSLYATTGQAYDTPIPFSSEHCYGDREIWAVHDWSQSLKSISVYSGHVMHSQAPTYIWSWYACLHDSGSIVPCSNQDHG